MEMLRFVHGIVGDIDSFTAHNYFSEKITTRSLLCVDGCDKRDIACLCGGTMSIQ